MRDELLPCPFCGHKSAEMRGKYLVWVRWWVQCPRCSARTDSFVYEEEAVEAWNERTMIDLDGGK